MSVSDINSNLYYRKFGRPGWGALSIRLAAAAVIVAAAAVVIVGYTVVATAAEQNQQDDDPAPVTATETIVIHKRYLQEIFSRQCRSFQDIPLHKICAVNFYLTNWSIYCRLKTVYRM